MATRDEITTVVPRTDPFRTALTAFEMLVAVVMLILGLWQWSVIVGLVQPSFEPMPLLNKVATMYLAVAYLVAAVGLWMRVAWGRVIFVATAISVIALHTALIATYGSNWVLVGMQLVLLAIYATLAVMARRQPARTA